MLGLSSFLVVVLAVGCVRFVSLDACTCDCFPYFLERFQLSKCENVASRKMAHNRNTQINVKSLRLKEKLNSRKPQDAT